jgi:MoxR-like ATPase
MTDWLAYRGAGEPGPTTPARRLPDPPPWRKFETGDEGQAEQAVSRATTFQASPREIEMVNAALYLRRPLLVTGRPGTGKSSLAYSVAAELGLGEVLHWPINSRSTLREGLYDYDAVARLQDAGLQQRTGAAGADIGRYLTLGPLGTALLPGTSPRVLLVDELDKSDVDLPNDLLTVFEEGHFAVPELVRWRDRRPEVRVLTADPGASAEVSHGVIRCREFPLVIITSNGEREFPAAFLRRCLRLDVQEPDRAKLELILTAHLGTQWLDEASWLVDQFLSRRDEGELATDQLLNAVYLVQNGLAPELDRASLAARLLPYLDSTTAT